MHAARYATKYVTKVPQYGFPEWVFDIGDEGKQIKRYTASHGFFGSRKKEEAEPGEEVDEEEPAKEAASAPHAADCFCEECRERPPCTKPRRKQLPLRQRLARCGQESMVVEVPFYETDEGVKRGRPAFVRMIPMTFANARRLCRVEEDGPFFISEREFAMLGGWEALKEDGLVVRARSEGSYLGGEVNPGDVARVGAFDSWNEGCTG